MCEFFKLWRRKAGVVTLAMACVFTAGWVRSLETSDAIGWSECGKDFIHCGSESGYLWSQWMVEPDEASFIEWESKPAIECQMVDAIDVYGRRVAIDLIYLPYWLIVVPLTLLSAYLLLGKPRTATPPAQQPT